MPERVQQRRTAGWRKPEGAIACGRGTPRGNPFRVVKLGPGRWTLEGPDDVHPVGGYPVRDTRAAAHRDAVARFERHTLPGWPAEQLDALRGRDLMCWCPPELPCHVDAILARLGACPDYRCEHAGRIWSVTVGTTWQVLAVPGPPDPPDQRAWDRLHEAIAAGGTIRWATTRDRETWAELVHAEDQLRHARTVDERRAIMCTTAPTAADRPLF